MKRATLTVKAALIFIVCVTGILIAGCGQAQKDSAGAAGTDIAFQTGVFSDNNWDDQFGTYYGDAIPDEQVAVNVAVQIYDGMQKSSDEKGYVPQYVFFDEQSEVWIVSFWPERSETDEIILGGECNIALRKTDGKVMRIWYTE